MTVALRAASPRDAADLFRLIQDHAAFEQSAASLTLRDLENILAAEAAPARLIVADDAGVLLGYAAITFANTGTVATPFYVRSLTIMVRTPFSGWVAALLVKS